MCFAGLAQAATYYVSPAGSDSNAGSLSAPFATLQKAANLANPGDTIYMRGGTYVLSDSAVQIGRSGASGSPITVVNYPGEAPILDGANITTSYRSAIQLNASWWHFKGLEIKNAAAMGVYIASSSSNNTIELCNLHNNVRIQGSGAGIQIDSAAGGNNVLLNNDSHHNGINAATGQMTSSTGGDGIGNSSTAAGNVIRGNRVWRNADDGIDMWGAYGALVEGNWSWENGKYDNGTLTSGNGTGFKLGGASGTPNGAHTIQLNMAWSNSHNGFDDNSANVPMNVYNNTGYNNGGANFSFYSPVAFVLKNNLAYVAGITNVNLTDTQLVQANNSWNLAVTVGSSDFVSLDYSGAAGPRNADGSLPNIAFLNLASGSDLIGKGVDVGLPYTGSAPNLGAYRLSTLPAPTNLQVVAQ